MTVRLTESQLQGMVTEMAELFGYSVCHVFPLRTKHGYRTPTTVKGWPDAVFYGPKGHFYVEFKAAHGRVTPEQAAVHEKLRAAGQRVFVWKPADLDSGRIQKELGA